MASVVFLEGNIGAGKSTVLRELDDRGYIVMQEPVTMWTEHLARAYSDKRWSLPMHYMALVTHSEVILQALRTAKTENTIVVVERSFQSIDVFADCDEDLRDKVEYWTLHNMYRRLVQEELDTVDCKRLYLRTDPSVCFERMRTRDRLGEDAIPMDYIDGLHGLHESRFRGEDTDVIDGNGSLCDVMASVAQNVAPGVRNVAPGGPECRPECVGGHM